MAYWEQDEERDWYCSECGKEAPYEFRGWDKHGFMDYTPIYTMILSKYCPYCGAKMEYEKAYVPPPPRELTEEEKKEQMEMYEARKEYYKELKEDLAEKISEMADFIMRGMKEKR